MKKPFFKQLGSGLSYYPKALSFIFENGLWYYFFFPLVLNLLLFFLGLSTIGLISDYLSNELHIWIFGEGADTASSWKDWLFSPIAWIIWGVLKIGFFFLFALFGGYITIIILSPVLTFLSEKTAEIVTGEKIPFNILQFTRDVVRAVLITLRNMFLQLGLTIALMFLNIIPFIGTLAALLGNFIISSYFYGFSFIDYSNERKKLSIKESVQFLRKNKGLSVGIGMVFSFCFYLPFLGGVIASFIAIVSTVAATLAVIECRN
jgi:CysZ protein